MREDQLKDLKKLLSDILIALERIEKRVNQCTLCHGFGSRTYQNVAHLCGQCNGLGVMRNE
jgi:DnaJ-class molecular chaperone